MQVPIFTIVTENSDTVHTDVVDDVIVTIKPESDVANTVNGVIEKDLLVTLVKEIVWLALVIEIVRCKVPAGKKLASPAWFAVKTH